MICIGIDPGVSGAIAVVHATRGLLEVAPLPTCHNGAGNAASVSKQIDPIALRRLVQGMSARHDFARESVRVVIERMTSHGPADKTPAASLLSMGYSAGICEGVLAAFASEPVIKVLPRQWKPAFGLAREKGEAAAAYKARSVAEARHRFPAGQRLTHDKAEAALIALWGLGEVTAPAVVVEDDPFAVEAS